MALAGVLGGAAIAWGQHGHTGSHDEGHRAAQACATEFEQVVGEFVESKPKSARLVQQRRTYHEARWGGR